MGNVISFTEVLERTGELVKSNLLMVVVLVLVFLVGSYGCGSKGGSSVEPTSPTTPATPPIQSKTISFTPSGSPSSNSVYLEKVSVNGNEITLAVKVKGGLDVYAAAPEIDFDSSKIQFVSASEGTFLNQGGVTTSFHAKLENGWSGVLLIGVSRQAGALGITGNGTLSVIVLKALVDQTNTVITVNSANSLLKSPDGDIAGTSWFGGGLSYN